MTVNRDARGPVVGIDLGTGLHRLPRFGHFVARDDGLRLLSMIASAVALDDDDDAP